MKRVLLLCFIGMAALKTHAAPPNPPQPFTAVIWTTTTLHSPGANPSIFTERAVYTRDTSGHVRREVYQPTKGLQQDTSAPLEHVVTGSSSPKALPTVGSSEDVVGQDVDLGTKLISGVLATGRRQTFHDAKGQYTHTLETWFSADLGLTVRMDSSDARGNTVFSQLSELHLDNPVSPSIATAAVAGPAIPLLRLYRGLFTQIAHMERDRKEKDPNRHVNMEEIEDHLRNKMKLSASDWQVLVDKSVKVEDYTREISKQARSFADQDRAARRENPLSANTLAAGRATLHAMQMDLNTHVQGEIDQIKGTVGPEATGRIEAYLQGPLAASTSVVPFNAVRSRAQKEAAR